MLNILYFFSISMSVEKKYLKLHSIGSPSRKIYMHCKILWYIRGWISYSVIILFGKTGKSNYKIYIYKIFLEFSIKWCFFFTFRGKQKCDIIKFQYIIFFLFASQTTKKKTNPNKHLFCYRKFVMHSKYMQKIKKNNSKNI